MPEYKLTFHWEAILKAVDEEDAEEKYFQGIGESNETLDTIASESLTITQV